MRRHRPQAHPWLLIVQVVLIVLKLTGNLSWSWVAVLAPMWISWILLLLGVLLICIGRRNRHML